MEGVIPEVSAGDALDEDGEEGGCGAATAGGTKGDEQGGAKGESKGSILVFFARHGDKRAFSIVVFSRMIGIGSDVVLRQPRRLWKDGRRVVLSLERWRLKRDHWALAPLADCALQNTKNITHTFGFVPRSLSIVFPVAAMGGNSGDLIRSRVHGPP